MGAEACCHSLTISDQGTQLLYMAAWGGVLYPGREDHRQWLGVGPKPVGRWLGEVGPQAQQRPGDCQYGACLGAWGCEAWCRDPWFPCEAGERGPWGICLLPLFVPLPLTEELSLQWSLISAFALCFAAEGLQLLTRFTGRAGQNAALRGRSGAAVGRGGSLSPIRKRQARLRAAGESPAGAATALQTSRGQPWTWAAAGKGAVLTLSPVTKAIWSASTDDLV